MKISIYVCVLALALCALAGCEEEPTVVTTTTETTTTTTGPATYAGTRQVYVAEAPPAVRVESRTVSPGAGYVWTGGYWRWTGNQYVWVRGGWVTRPRPAAVYVEGHWLRRPGGWVWVPGHWR
jgi:hypothetical protein